MSLARTLRGPPRNLLPKMKPFVSKHCKAFTMPWRAYPSKNAVPMIMPNKLLPKLFSSKLLQRDFSNFVTIFTGKQPIAWRSIGSIAKMSFKNATVFPWHSLPNPVPLQTMNWIIYTMDLTIYYPPKTTSVS